MDTMYEHCMCVRSDNVCFKECVSILFVVSIVTRSCFKVYSLVFSLSLKLELGSTSTSVCGSCVGPWLDEMIRWEGEDKGKEYIEERWGVIRGNSVWFFWFVCLSLFLPSDKAQCKINFRLYWPRPDFPCRFVFCCKGDLSDSLKERNSFRAMA